MRDCPSTEPNADFDFVAFIQELSRVLQTGIEICFTNGWAQADFLDGDSLLFLPSIALFLLQLEPELPVVHDTGYRWLGIRRY